jgi:hypothetical protein
MERQAANGHAIINRPERHPNVFRLRRTWLKVAGEALDLLNLIDVAQSNTAADNTLVFEAIYDKVKQLKRTLQVSEVLITNHIPIYKVKWH